MNDVASEASRGTGSRPALEDPSINICFSTTDALLSRWIRFVTRSQVSHALITFRDQTLGRVLVMEATGRGLNVVPWRRWRQKNTLVARFRPTLPLEDQVRALHRMGHLLGSEYDTISLWGFACRRWQKRAKNPLDDPTKLICSEAVARMLKIMGVKSFRRPGDWTPAEVYRFVRARPRLFEPVEEGPASDRPWHDDPSSP
ncbi:MAG: hypothetical protein ACOC97_03745 [Myxococcota bacterium]